MAAELQTLVNRFALKENGGRGGAGGLRRGGQAGAGRATATRNVSRVA